MVLPYRSQHEAERMAGMLITINRLFARVGCADFNSGEIIHLALKGGGENDSANGHAEQEAGTTVYGVRVWFHSPLQMPRTSH